MNCPHCETEVDEHEANRCLSGWVHVDVMGRKLPDHNWETDTYCECLPDYSTSIAAAWEVLDHLARSDFAVHWIVSEGYNCSVLAKDWVNCTASTAPLAICRAALKATVKEFA